MIDWVAIQPVLENWVEEQAPSLRNAVYWNAQQSHQHRPFARMQIRSTRQLGEDMTQWACPAGQPAGREATSRQAGNRQFTLRCQIVSRDQRPSQSAHYLAECLRTSLRKPSVIADMAAVEVAMVRTHSLVVLDNVFQSRYESVANLDIDLATVARETDAREEYGIIEKALVSSDIKNVDGASVPDALQLTDVEIP